MQTLPSRVLFCGKYIDELNPEAAAACILLGFHNIFVSHFVLGRALPSVLDDGLNSFESTSALFDDAFKVISIIRLCGPPQPLF